MGPPSRLPRPRYVGTHTRLRLIRSTPKIGSRPRRGGRKNKGPRSIFIRLWRVLRYEEKRVY